MSAMQPDGYLALPPTGTGKGVLVLHAWWGLNATIKAFCERLATAGYVAFAPDLYHGQVASTIAEAETLRDALDGKGKQTRDDLAAALTLLKERADAATVAVIGFSLGASYALDLSVADPATIRAVVIFYGTCPGDYSRAQASYLGHFAEADEFEPAAAVNQLEESLLQAGRPVAFYTYSGTGHWFCEPDRVEAYNQEAAELAWERTLAFLQQS